VMLASRSEVVAKLESAERSGLQYDPKRYYTKFGGARRMRQRGGNRSQAQHCDHPTEEGSTVMACIYSNLPRKSQ
jgi:hypothetical protein